MRTSETIGALVAALAKAQLDTRNPALDRAHPHFKGFRYASLGAHLEAIREPFARHGLVVTQHVTGDGAFVAVTTMIAHTSGEFMASTMQMALPDKATAQNIGANITYLRRYALASMALLTGDDDTDGEEDRAAREEERKPQPRPERRDVFDPRPVAQTAPAPAKKSWPANGIGSVKCVKSVPRGDVVAVLCEHPDHGSLWVSAARDIADGMAPGRTVELVWGTAKGGHIEALETRGIPAATDEEVPF